MKELHLGPHVGCGPSRSSLIPIQAGVPQGSVLGPVLFMVFINDLSDSLENPLYLFADDSTLCRTICHPSDRQAAAFSLTADLGKVTNWSNTWNVSFNPDKSHTLTMSLGKDRLETPPHPLSQQSSGRSPFFQASGSHNLP